MCRTVRCTPPPAEQLRSAIINAGFRVSGSHACPLALKTDAPPKVVWDIIRSWVKLHPIKAPEPGSYPANILSKPVETEADFRKAAGAIPESVKAGVKRFVQNPAFWGPKARHGRPLKPEQQKQQQAQAEQRRSRQQQQQQQQGEEQQQATREQRTQPVETGGSASKAATADSAVAAAAVAEPVDPAAADDLLQSLYDADEAAAGGDDSSPPHKKAKQ